MIVILDRTHVINQESMSPHRYKLMEEKGYLFLIVECQLMNVESVTEIESYHLADYGTENSI